MEMGLALYLVKALKMSVITVLCLALFAFVFIKLLGEEALRTFFVTILTVWLTTATVYAMYGG